MIQKELLKNGYYSGRSMMQIAETLNVSHNQVRYWMNKYGFIRRSRSEALYIRNNPAGDPFEIKTNLNKKDQHLKGIGIGIYWGEGDKLNKYSVRVANSDPKLILTFRHFLREICQVKEGKIKYSLITFNDIDADSAARYWAKMLETSLIQFGKITSIPPQGKGTYLRKSRYGVCTLSVSNIKLKSWILSQMEVPN